MVKNRGQTGMIVLIIFAVVGGLWGLYSIIKSSKDIEKGKGDVVIIDNCQYLSFPSYMGYVGLTHKGNCNNPIHIYKR